VENEYKAVKINMSMSAKTNKLLSESALRSNRSKVCEAELRLADHVENYKSISYLNQKEERGKLEEEKSSS